MRKRSGAVAAKCYQKKAGHYDERSGANPIEATCSECGAITQIASGRRTGRPDDRCGQGHAKNVLWCPSMHRAISEARARASANKVAR
jgi:hypothetical protein